ncbi:protein-disulfide reductase DsbD family protein [Aliidiomarina taiwanensis]|nr:thioredoxin family protein [Aliidiomarina taiwanensis]
MFIWLLASSAQANSHLAESPLLKATLLSEHSRVVPGRISSLAIALTPAANTFTHWSGPQALAIEWHGPDGTYFDETQWPKVQTIETPAGTPVGFAGPHYLLVDYAFPTSLDPTQHPTVTLGATLHWQVCQQSNPSSCQAGSSELSVSIPLGNTFEPSQQQQFQQARAQQPVLAPWPAHFDIQANQLTLLIESQAAVEHVETNGGPGQTFAFIGAGRHLDLTAEQSVETVDNLLVIRQPLQANAQELGHADFPKALQVQLSIGSAQYELLATKVTPTLANSAQAKPLGLVFAFAFLGGLLLNLMPCVFPVLSLKAMALAQGNQAGHGSRIKQESLWYTFGVVLSFLVIAATLMALRAAGQALGWGFQLQNPWLIAGLTLLFVAIGLNLAGTFQVGTRFMGLGQGQLSPSQHTKARQSFATGVLAVLVASPCTAPFMGVALGYAITQPPVLALSIFAALGLGLAAPFFIIGFVPALARLLPRPGPWMETFKEWMAIPMYITAVWLLWVFGRQTGIDSLVLMLLTIVLFATALWWWGKQQLRATRRSSSIAVVWLLLALAAATFYQSLAVLQATATSHTVDAEGAWSQTKLDQLRTQQPVFVNMTADWCITCLANERVALTTDATEALFAQHQVAVLTGDWTLQDPAITKYLATFGRNGVPLYVLYWPGKEPQVLPQILSNRIIREHIEANLN